MDEQSLHERIQDFADTVVDTRAKADRRNRAMERAHEAGFDACEICGRAIRTQGVTVAPGLVLGATCAAKARAAGIID